jgi:hypothetical protein
MTYNLEILCTWNITTELCDLTVKKVVLLFLGVNLEPNFGIDNDKNLDGTPEERIILKSTHTIIFEDLNYATYKSTVWIF